MSSPAAQPPGLSYLDAAREDPARGTLAPGFPFVRTSGTSTPLHARSPAHENAPAPAPEDGGRTQVFVGNLPYRVRWQDLKDLFRNAGPHHLTILRADVTLLPDNRSKGSGTVLFATREDALRAIEAYNGYNWQGRVLDVHFDTQDPTGAGAIANAQHAQTQGPQMIGIPMMHFMPGQGSQWPSPAQQPASLPAKSNISTISTSPPSSSRPSSSAGQKPGTPATSPGEQPSETPVSIAITSASGATMQIPAGFPQGVAMVPVPVMMSQGGSGPQMFALPQYAFQPGSFMYYTPQGFRPSPGPGAGAGVGVPPGYQNRHLFVGNLPFNCQWQDLKDLFRTAGNILRADITTGPDGRSRGFGTVLFATTEDAQNAVRMFNGSEYQGRQLKVHFDKFAGQQHPSQGLQGQPTLPHRNSAPVLPTQGMAQSMQPTHSGSFNNGYLDGSAAMSRDGSAHSAIPANEEANRPIIARQGASAPHLPSVHGAIHPPHAYAGHHAEPTQVFGPSALMSPGPGQTADMQAFASAAALYADQHRGFAPQPPPLSHGQSHLRQSTVPEDEQQAEGGQQGENGAPTGEPVRTPDEHPGPLHVQIPPPPFFGPLSPQQSRGVPMTPSMPGFSFHPFPQTPPLMPHFLSPGLGPFSPPLGHPQHLPYAAPGMPMQYAMGTPTSAEAPGGFGPGYFPSLGSVMAGQPIPELPQQEESAPVEEEAAVQAPAEEQSVVSPPRPEKSTPKSFLDTKIFEQSALAARRASNQTVRSRADANLGLLPSALEATSPLMNATSPAMSPHSGPKSDGSDELSSKVSRLDIGPAAADEGPARRASFFDTTLLGNGRPSGGPRRRLGEEEAGNAPRRSSFDGGAPDSKAKLKRFGQSIWQL